MSSSIALTTSYSFPFKCPPSLNSRYKPRISSAHSPFTSSSSFRPLTLTLPSSSIVAIITQPLPLAAALLTKTLTFAAAFSAFGHPIPWLVKSLCQACGSNVGDGTEGKLGSWLMLTCFQNSVISSSMFFTAMAANPLSANLAFSTIGKTIGWMDWAKAAIVPGLVSLLVVNSSPDAPRLAKEKLATSTAPVTPQFQPPEFDVRPYLSSSMPGPELKVAVLVSGGVDSSVALRLLHAARHSCTAFYLKIWFQEDFENFWSECPWEEDLAYVKAVCNQIDVPLEVVHLTDEYWEKVVSYIIEEYRNGRTPNPDVLCNTRIKFGAFMDAISTMGFDYVASGHYANVLHPAADVSDQPSILKLSRDVVKDQTYFLSHLDQSQLKRLIFPLGHIPKNEVRKLAMQFDLPNKDRKDSQGICFLGKIKFSDFVARQIGEIDGVILEAETGDFLGKHRGFWFYTIGQRQGLRLPGGPWYVVEKDTENNVIFVSRSYYSVDKRRRVFRVGSLKWLNGKPPEKLGDLQCKVRHGPSMYSCSLTRETCENSHGDVAVVHLSEDDQGLAAGQFAAFYQGNTCIGSGIILESWDDQGFPVCDKALEIARLPDKSKLGKPVKITVKPEDSPA